MIQKVKKPISIVLALMMVVSLFTIVPITASAAETYERLSFINVQADDVSGAHFTAHADECSSKDGKGWCLDYEHRYFEIVTLSSNDRTTKINKLVLHTNSLGALPTIVVANGTNMVNVDCTKTSVVGNTADYTFENVNATNVYIYATGSSVGSSAGSTLFCMAWADVYYTAPDPTTYTVTWKNGDTVLKTDTVDKDAIPAYTGTAPEKAEDEDYTYTFSGWSDGTNTYGASDTLPAVTGDVTYTAQFDATAKVQEMSESFNANQYMHYDGDCDENIADRIDSTNVTITPDDEMNAYDAGWSPYSWQKIYFSTKNGNVIRKILITSRYQYAGRCITNGRQITGVKVNNVITYDKVNASSAYVTGISNAQQITVYFGTAYIPVTWKNGDTVLKTDYYDMGETPTYTGTAPEQAEDEQYTYTFSGWSDGTTTYGKDEALPAVSGDITYTATFDETAKALPEVIKDCTYQKAESEVYANVPFLPADEEDFSSITEGAIGCVCKSGVIQLIDAKEYSYKFYDQTGTEIAATLSYSISVPGSSADLSDDVTLYLKQFTPANPDNLDKVYIVATAPTTYTVTWKNGDTVLKTDTVEEGTAPAYTGTAPEKAEDAENTYTFSCWTDGTTTYGKDDTLPAVTGDVTYTAQFTAKPKTLIVGHSLTLDGNIGINFYLDPSVAGMTADQVTADNLSYSFAWADGNALVDVAKQAESKAFVVEDGKIKFTCKVCAAEMTCGVKASFKLGDKSGSEVYSVRDYCDNILTPTPQWLNAYKAKYPDGTTKCYDNLLDLTKKMLDYGAKAQAVFGIKTDDLANHDLTYTMQDVDGDMFTAAVQTANGRVADDIAAKTPAGASFKAPSLVFLSENTLRLYFEPQNDSFSTAGLTEWNDYYYAQVANIPAAELDTLQTFNVSGTELRYSALDYAKALADTDNADLAMALYWYNQAANVFFHTHTPGTAVQENVVPSTCSAEGSYDEVVYCSECHAELSREQKTIDKLAHTPGAAVQENVVSSTCSAEGSYDEVVYCSECHAEISRETKTIDMLAHTPGEPVQENVVPATCSAEGSYDEVVYCSECHAELSRVTKTIDMLAHTPGAAVRENVVPATCKAAGSYDEVVYCSECNEELSRIAKTIAIDPNAHTITAVPEKPATAEATGVKAHYKCSVCGKLFTDSDGKNETTAAALVIPMLKILDLGDVKEGTTVTVENGYTIAGTLQKDCKISIADGATVTLKDVNITNLGENCEWAGISCTGDATIMLEGKNIVKGGYEDFPGVFVPESKTLTIDGTGSLNASSNGYGCGIGGGFSIPAGNIVINGGTIIATGGDIAAGIGSGNSASCGNITITGGTITAKGGFHSAGIGSGANGSSCGNITISANVTSVTATKGSGALNSIGKGYSSSSCGTVTIAPGAKVTQN